MKNTIENTIGNTIENPTGNSTESVVERISSRLYDWGATIIGFSDVKEAISSKLLPYSNCITIGIRLSDGIINQIQDAPTFTYFHHYRTANFLLDQIAFRATMFIMDEGFGAIAVPASQTVNDIPVPYSGIFQHKTGACKAGLGFMGKSGLFISKKYGPRVRLASILTDMPIRESTYNAGTCGTCLACVKSCPAGAITGIEWSPNISRDEIVDAKACSEYMNKHFKKIGRGSVCGICIKVCPFGIC